MGVKEEEVEVWIIKGSIFIVGFLAVDGKMFTQEERRAELSVCGEVESVLGRVLA